jgi:hypothetical protein
MTTTTRDPAAALRDLVNAIEQAAEKRPIIGKALAEALDAATATLRFGPKPEDERIALLESEIRTLRKQLGDMTSDWCARVDDIRESARRDALDGIRTLWQRHRSPYGLSIMISEYGTVISVGGQDLARTPVQDVGAAVAQALAERKAA